MPMHLYDSYTREKREFIPADPDRVTVYCCGPTVYAPPHIGNARAAVNADMLIRVLRHEFGAGHVRYARNFTDIDDKIMKAAREEGVEIGVITARATEAYLAGLDALGCQRPDVAPRATETIPAMQALVSTLLARGHAYAGDGHILFDTKSFDRYGKLSGLDRDAIIAGARVEVAPYKKDPADFVLWKPSADDEPGWDVPARWPIEGRGRPGWHLECSAMIRDVLGETIDIHCGGQDLRFPHHENEIAQSCCGTETGDTPLARFWFHNGMLRLDGAKMSKSVGNIETPQELLARWSGEVLRFALLTAQYRQPLDWSEELLASCKSQLDRFYRVLSDVAEGGEVAPGVRAALTDDVNTPQAIAALHELREKASAGDKAAAASLRASGELMGLFSSSAEGWFQQGSGDGPTADEIEALIAERQQARKDKDFARSDQIRDDLAAKGVILEDGPDGVTWRRG
ncbi:cysteine--tRNA ligase [Parvularcula marina]|uniref:cysteine--tRNA ligase n=1 Tax=Parvularcula marina TaxID=2292771 RepID=UPI0035128F88